MGTVYKSLGNTAQDIAAAWSAYEFAVANDLGQEIAF